MNKEWSDLNKQMQNQIKKEQTFDEGIKTLLALRKNIMSQIDSFRHDLTQEQFSAIPFMNVKGYHSKTIAYSIYHIFRIEDIVANSLIRSGQDIFTKGRYQEKMNSSIATTGNELKKMEIAHFSSELNIDELYNYVNEVNRSTTELLAQMQFIDLKIKYADSDKERLLSMGGVSKDEDAVWLVDYWCGKNIQGLIQMPFSRHWIMHTEAALRIQHRLLK